MNQGSKKITKKFYNKLLFIKYFSYFKFNCIIIYKNYNFIIN